MVATKRTNYRSKTIRGIITRRRREKIDLKLAGITKRNVNWIQKYLKHNVVLQAADALASAIGKGFNKREEAREKIDDLATETTIKAIAAQAYGWPSDFVSTWKELQHRIKVVKELGRNPEDDPPSIQLYQTAEEELGKKQFQEFQYLYPNLRTALLKSAHQMLKERR